MCGTIDRGYRQVRAAAAVRGVAVIEDHGRLTAGREMGIAVAGPLQNGIMILLALALKQAEYGSSAYLDYFIGANAMIALFNLLPVLPLDGGKILQAALSLLLPYYYTLLWIGRVQYCGQSACCGVRPASAGNRRRTPS